jgi:ubiquinol-cytochrome c reductase cytochrome b subunit
MPATRIRKVNRFVDERLGTQEFLKRAFNHIFPDNWSFMLGEFALYCFVLIVLSGVYLSFFFDPSDHFVTYTGSYLPLRGVSMSSAYQSTVQLSLDVRAGLLFRQIHHWSADLFIAVIVVHLCRIFFTGAYRKPRDINWMVGLTLFLLSLFNGFTGYSLPDDLLSGAGLRIAYSIALSVPVIGNWLAYLLFGGQFPSDQLTHRLFIAHVLLVPGLIIALLGVHLGLIWHQKHTQFPGPGRSERRLVGSQLWPTYTAKSIGLFCGVTGAVGLLSGFAQINPIWLYGPYKPESASAASQPDWYVGWLEGTLRLFPAWRLHLFGYTVSEVFWPAALFPIVTFVVLYCWPAVERRVTGQTGIHNLLDRPRHHPARTGMGVAGITLGIVLLVAGGQDVLAHFLQVTQPPVTLVLRGMAIGLPPIAGIVAWKICRDLAGGELPAVETPKGSNDSATPPTTLYLPPRAAVEDAGQPATTDGDRSAVKTVALGAGVASALAVGLARAVKDITHRGRRSNPPSDRSEREP